MLNPGLNQGPLDFSLKCLRVFCYTTSLFAFLLHFPPSLPHSPFLSLSVLLLSFLFHLFSCFSFSLLLLLAEKLTQKKNKKKTKQNKQTSRHRRNWSVFIHATLPIIHFLTALFFPLEWAEDGLLKQRWVFLFSFTYRPTHRNGGVSSLGSDYCPARQTQTNPLFSRATVTLTFMSTQTQCGHGRIWQSKQSEANVVIMNKIATTSTVISSHTTLGSVISIGPH